MNESLAYVRKHAFDALLVVVAAYGIIAVVVQDFAARGASALIAAAAMGLLVLLLLARHRFPFAAPASMWLLAATVSLVEGGLVSSSIAAFFAGTVASFLLGNLEDRTRSRIGLVVIVCASAVVVFNAPSRSTAQLFFVPVQFSMAWLAGYALWERAARVEAAEERAALAERERESAARIAVAEERARIARELHDVVAHSVSVMVLQVGAVRHNLPDSRGEDTEALKNVEETGRTALTEMRRLLGAMRYEGEDPELAPQPGLDDLESLAEDFALAGLPVHLHIEGEPKPLPRAIDLSAYRIIQEGLTNALKHARATRADVTILHGSGDVRIEVRDDGMGTASENGTGFGLLGIRERVSIFGGEMEAGPNPAGGFVLRAHLPLGGERS